MKHFFVFLLIINCSLFTIAQPTQKPPLHGKNWMAITGKPLAATAGSIIFQQGGNAVDAACAMLAATCTMWDVLSWGGETQTLIYNPKTKKVIGINALGVAPTGATAEFYKSKGFNFPPEYGPLAAVTPGTPGGLCYMLAEYGTMSLKQVLAPAMQLAAGYPIEAQTANAMERGKRMIKEWPYSKAVFLPHLGENREAPEAGEIFVQKDLLETLTKMVEAEQDALKKKKSRKEAIMAAFERFYKGDIAKEFVRGCQEQGGLITMEDLAKWKPIEEEPMHVNYKGIEVYKLQQWTQGPMLLQALNILENFDLKSMGYNSAKYIHTIYQTMNLAFADRDFYYGDPYFEPKEPMTGLLSKQYAMQRAKLITFDKNDANAGPGDPYPYEGKSNPFVELLKQRGYTLDSSKRSFTPAHDTRTGYNPSPYQNLSSSTGMQFLNDLQKLALSDGSPASGGIGMAASSPGFVPSRTNYENHSEKLFLGTSNELTSHSQKLALCDGSFPLQGDGRGFGPDSAYLDRLLRGTTSVEAADKEGWVVSITPSGGWLPACIAGRTGVGMSQRLQSFVLDASLNPFNVIQPGKRPRVTLTPTLAMKDGKPFLSFAVQGGDTQDQNLLQFFLNIVEFGMTVQEATEAANINSNQLWLSLGGTKTSDRQPRPGNILLHDKTPEAVLEALRKMGYNLTFDDRTSGPINAIWFDWKHGTFWGGSSNHGEDYGIGW